MIIKITMEKHVFYHIFLLILFNLRFFTNKIAERNIYINRIHSIIQSKKNWKWVGGKMKCF